MDAFVTRISRAPMTDIRVEFDGLSVNAGDVFPARIPDLFAGRPVMISGRFAQGGPALRAGSNPVVRISGNIAGERRTTTVPIRINTGDAGGSPAALAAVWARHKIATLADRRRRGRPRGGRGEYSAGRSGVRSDVAVHRIPRRRFSTRTEGSYGTSIAVPVPIPEGVQYSTTVPEVGR